MKRAAILCLGVILLFTSTCAYPGGKHLNVWPFVYYNEDEKEGTKTVSILTPLAYYHRSKEGKSEFSIRPLFSIVKDTSADSTVIDILYPLMKFKKNGQDKKFMLVPLIKEQTDDIYPNKTRTSSDYFPLYWGTSEEGESYGGLFPLYGTVKHRFGKDEIMFLLWPVYSRTKEDGFVSHSVLWPVFKKTTGANGWGMRVFPLWGHEEETGVNYKTFYLFPLVTFRGRYLNTDSPMTDTLFIPFYAHRQTPHSWSTSYLWPLFSVSYDKDTNYRRIDMPWPFVAIARSDTLSLTQFAPFYRKRVTTQNDSVDESRYFFYPIYTEGHFTSPKMNEDSHRFMLIDKYIETKYADGSQELWIYLFPAYDRRMLKSGEESTALLYPLPLYDDGFKRNWLPLFEVYRKDTTAEGDTVTKILHHLYIKKIKDGIETIEAPFYFKERKR